MGFQDNIPGIYTRALNQLGVSGVYSPAVGDPVSCKVIIDYGAELAVDGLDIEAYELGITIKALRSVVGSPKHGDTFTVDGTTYTVARPEPVDSQHFIKVVVNEN